MAEALKRNVNKQIQDETHYCENCGISFVWTREEQRQWQSAQALLDSAPPSLPIAPTHCAGCRMLLPPAARARGLVKWYHRRKGYGFISRLGAPDLYVHRTAVDVEALVTDDLVEFAVGDNAQGPAAVAVRLLAHATG